MLTYTYFLNYTLNNDLIGGNKSHLLTFLQICKDKHLIKCKIDILNEINIFFKIISLEKIVSIQIVLLLHVKIHKL